jgi:D-arabinose 1-dehydrogenase-like Zn-dependent alcohol dehydrogenase
LALELGAHVYIDTDAANPAEELAKMGGARVILAATPSGQAVSQVINGLGHEGELILLATQSEPIQVSPMQLARSRRTIRGWVGQAARNPSEDALQFSVLAGVRPRIEVFPLEQAAQAFDRMMAAKVHFRSVLQIGETE